MTTLEQRLEPAATLRRSGHNCAQCVMLAFSDIISDRMPEDAAEAFSIALGGGVGGTGHVCGAISAMASTIGIMRYTSPADKMAIYKEVQGLTRSFAELNGGITECRLLRVPGAKSCNLLIQDAVTILHNHISSTDAAE